MPGVFIGSTELTAVGDIKIGGTDVQEVYVGATKVFPSGAPPFTPPDIAGLQFWFDASDASTITETLGVIDEWRDKSTFSRDVANTNAAEKPQKTTDGGFDSVFFEQDRLENTSISMTLSDGTAFMVGRVTVFNDISGFWAFLDGGSQHYMGLRLAGEARFSLSGIADTFFLKDTTVKFWLQSDWEGGTGLNLLDDLGSTDSAASASTLNVLDKLVLGSRAPTTSGVIEGPDFHMHELICYDTVLSSEDKTAVQDYLEAKWGFL